MITAITALFYFYCSVVELVIHDPEAWDDTLFSLLPKNLKERSKFMLIHKKKRGVVQPWLTSEITSAICDRNAQLKKPRI